MLTKVRIFVALKKMFCIFFVGGGANDDIIFLLKETGK